MRKSMKQILAILMVAIFLINIPLIVQAAPGDVTPSGVAFDEIGSEIEKWAAENPEEYVSFVTAVFKEDEIVYEGAFGYADRENGIAADADTVYEWGSISKTLVWVSVMQLWERGEIDLEKDIREYLPENFLRKLKYDDPITMLNLMNHNAGWSENVWAFQTDDEERIESLGEVLQRTEPVQVYRPGEVSSYSNYGAALAGYIVECITGQSFHEYVHENIFEPLGMEHTSLLPAHNDNEWVYAQRSKTVCYTNTGAGWVSAGPQLMYVMPYPAGAATGTISDMAIYAGSLARKDCPLFENPETRELLFTPSATYNGTDIGYSYHGFLSSVYGETVVLGHNGSTNGFCSQMFFDVETGVGTVVMMTGMGLPIMEIPKIVFGDVSAEMPAELVASEDAGDDISGMYIGARSMRHGPLKLISLLGLLPIASVGEGEYDVAGIATIQNVSGELYWLVQEGQGLPAEGYQLEDGTGVLNLGLQSYVEEPALVAYLALMVFYVICVPVAAILLLIKLILLIAKKFKKYEGAALIAVAQFAKILSVGVVIFWISVYSTQYGLTPAQGIIGCLIQIVCMLAYLASAGISVKALFAKDVKVIRRIQYVINILANVICVVAVFSLELIRFWNV